MARVSSDEQAKGYSLDIQENNLRNWCEENNVEVVKCFREDHSAKDFNRPQWKELKAFAKSAQQEIDLLLITTWDRFSRNTTEAFYELQVFRKFGIEVQSIQQPIDFAIPESKVLLAIYLTIPEVDNDRRSMKIKEGIRAALKAGRWSRNAPRGYKNSRDDNNKPIIVPSENAKHIQFAFEEVAQGTSQQYILRQLSKKGFEVSKTALSLLLRNPVYIGKIKIPSNEEEPEQIIDGVHQGIVSFNLFYKVQQVLAKNYSQRNRKKMNSLKEELVLRGLIICSKCGNNVTGSASKSRNGVRHFYYHCNYCKKERYRSDLANKTIEEFLRELVFPEQLVKIYHEILIKLITKRREKDKDITDIEKVKDTIQKLEKKLERLQDLLLDDVITSDDYTKKRKAITAEINDLKATIEPSEAFDETVKQRIKNGINLLADIQKTYVNADTASKLRILGSIFPEKIEFQNLKCRTTRINSLIMLILLNNKDLKKEKTGQLFENLELSRLVESPGIEPKSGNLHIY